jgi:hypothetical protein
MVTIDEKALADHGIELPEEGADEFLSDLQAQAEERVGMAVVSHLGDDQAKQLLQLTENGSEDDVMEWLGKFMPDYEEVVSKEVEAVLQDVAAAQKAEDE